MFSLTNFEVNDLRKVKDAEISGTDRVILANNPKTPDRPVSSGTLAQLKAWFASAAQSLGLITTPAGSTVEIPIAALSGPTSDYMKVFCYGADGGVTVFLDGNLGTLLLISEDNANSVWLSNSGDVVINGTVTRTPSGVVTSVTGGYQFTGNGEFFIPTDATFDLGKGPVVRSPDGTLYRIKVANGGALSTEAV